MANDEVALIKPTGYPLITLSVYILWNHASSVDLSVKIHALRHCFARFFVSNFRAKKHPSLLSSLTTVYCSIYLKQRRLCAVRFSKTWCPLSRLLRLWSRHQEWPGSLGAWWSVAPGLLQMQSLPEGAERRVHQQVNTHLL